MLSLILSIPAFANQIELAEVSLRMELAGDSCFPSNIKLRNLIEKHQVGSLDDELFLHEDGNKYCEANFLVIGKAQNISKFERSVNREASLYRVQLDRFSDTNFSLITVVFPKHADVDTSPIVRYKFHSVGELHNWALAIRNSNTAKTRLELIKDKVDPKFFQGFESYYEDFKCVPGVSVLLFSTRNMGKTSNLKELCD